MSFAPINGTSIHYDITGAGEPLILIHAGICDLRMWDAQVETFSEQYRVLRYDMRGYGRSRMPDGPFSHYEDLHTLLQTVNIQSAILVGASFGGTIALDFALAYPAMVKALVIAGSSPSGTKPSEALVQKWTEIDEILGAGDMAKAVEMELQLWVDGPGRTSDPVDPEIRALVREMNTNNFEMANDNTEMQRLDPPAATRLGELHLPVLWMTGEYDVPDKVQIMQTVQLPNVERHLIPQAAHLPSMEHPAQFNTLVLNFLKRTIG